MKPADPRTATASRPDSQLEIDRGPGRSERRRGAQGEGAGGRLERMLGGRGVLLLHDLRIPGSRAGIDHLAVGPGGITVIDTKRYAGKVRVRGSRLFVGSSDRTKLVDSVLRQIGVVKGVLAVSRWEGIEVRGAICWVEGAGLPLLAQSLRGVRIDGKRGVSKLACRPGPLPAAEVRQLAIDLRTLLR